MGEEICATTWAAPSPKKIKEIKKGETSGIFYSFFFIYK